MSIIKIPVRRIIHADPQRGNTLPWISLEVTMTEEQMQATLNSILENISGETWAKWVAQINSECFGEVQA